ncbi:hypothetical protein CRE_31228 [Caenorhabditis remanei]|uniref:Uncharacterized protein n=1 Tax=Caenorhabditis remanei TaxID=31234 RepID=E3MLP8_CAERE|nr:hypothetical protein CRE_31228 [Caenorhabditis remanei]
MSPYCSWKPRSKRLIDIRADDNCAVGSTPAKTSDINATDTHYKRDEKKRAVVVLRMLQIWWISLGQKLQKTGTLLGIDWISTDPQLGSHQVNSTVAAVEKLKDDRKNQCSKIFVSGLVLSPAWRSCFHFIIATPASSRDASPSTPWHRSDEKSPMLRLLDNSRQGHRNLDKDIETEAVIKGLPLLRTLSRTAYAHGLLQQNCGQGSMPTTPDQFKIHITSLIFFVIYNQHLPKHVCSIWESRSSGHGKWDPTHQITSVAKLLDMDNTCSDQPSDNGSPTPSHAPPSTRKTPNLDVNTKNKSYKLLGLTS